MQDHQQSESAMGGVSVRGWLAVLLVATVCIISVAQAALCVKEGIPCDIKEPLYSLALVAVGYYFGQKTKTP